MGVVLPSELISSIATQVVPTDVYLVPDTTSRRQAKRQLVWLSLVCKYWAEIISPLIFRELRLRGREDLIFLREIVDGYRFSAFPLGNGVEVLDVHLDVQTQTKSWFGRLHCLSTKLPRAIIRCVVTNGRVPRDETIQASSAFRALPRLPPSYVRLTTLSLCGLAFVGVAEVRRLINTFATLKSCHCERLAFDDPSPLLRPRRTRRQSQLPLERFVVSQCTGASLHALSTLAFGCVGRSAHWTLESDTWAAILKASIGLVASATQCFSHIVVQRHQWDDTTVHLMLSTPPDADGSITDDLRVAVNICSPEDTQPHAAPSPAYVEKIVITSRAVDPSAATSVPWDVLNPIIVHPLFHTLHRALDSGKLRFGLVDDADEAAISRAEILAVPDTHTVYSTTLTSRNEYLQMLRAELAPDPPDYMVDANGDDVDDSTWVWAPSTAHVSQAGRDRSRTRYRENQRPVAGAAVGEDGPTSHASGLSLATSRSRAASV